MLGCVFVYDKVTISNDSLFIRKQLFNHLVQIFVFFHIHKENQSSYFTACRNIVYKQHLYVIIGAVRGKYHTVRLNAAQRGGFKV